MDAFTTDDLNDEIGAEEFYRDADFPEDDYGAWLESVCPSVPNR